MRCRNYLCHRFSSARNVVGGCVGATDTRCCEERRLFERIVREGHGHKDQDTADLVRGVRFMRELEERKRIG